MYFVTGSLGKRVAADKIASSLSIFNERSILLSFKISSINNIDSVRLGGSEVRGDGPPPIAPPTLLNGPLSELSDGTLSKLG